MTDTRTMLHIPKIEEGIVIDHIPAGLGTKLLELFQRFDELSGVVLSVGLNYKSKKIGRKDMIKLQIRDLSPRVRQQISIVSPGVTIKRIVDYRVAEKLVSQVPETISNLVKCRNPSCITNFEDHVETYFSCLDPEGQWFRCSYCERVFRLDELERILP